MIRDCAQFDELLMDLAYNELEEPKAAAMREHAVSCPACKAALESILLTRKLAARIPAVTAPSEWESSVLELAAKTVADRASTIPRERESDASFERGIGLVQSKPGFWDALRSWLLRPALVTAAAASVVFAVSFFVYRNATLHESDGRGARKGAPFVGPAIALAETAPREQTSAAPSSAFEESAKTTVADVARPAKARKAEPSTRVTQATRGGLGTTGPVPKNSADRLDGDGSGFREAPSSPSAGEFAAAAPASAAVEAPAAGAFEREGRMGGSAGGAGWPMASASNEPARPAPSDTYTVDDADHYRDGMNAYDRGDCAGAAASLELVIGPPVDAPELVPSALHHLARCEQRSGRCAKALIYYENLLSSHRAYPERAQALLEAAGCHRKLGHVERASSLLDQLAEIPGWRDRALAEKATLAAP